MSQGFKAGIPLPLGIGVLSTVQVGKGYSPLPFRIGVSTIGIQVGAGFPFLMSIGVVKSEEVQRKGGSSDRRLELRREDDEVLLAVIEFVVSEDDKII